MRKRAAGADTKLKRLYDAIENGVAHLGDRKDRIAELKATRHEAPHRRREGRGRVGGLGPATMPQALKAVRQDGPSHRTE
jgi:site-specific DNA recombinase